MLLAENDEGEWFAPLPLHLRRREASYVFYVNKKITIFRNTWRTPRQYDQINFRPRRITLEISNLYKRCEALSSSMGLGRFRPLPKKYSTVPLNSNLTIKNFKHALESLSTLVEEMSEGKDTEET